MYLHWILRVGVAAEFIGHGALGLPYLGVFGIPAWAAFKLMVVVGVMDITLGLLALLRPCRAIFLHMAVWGCMTALLRPAAGQGWWEFFERACSFGGPLALLLLHGRAMTLRHWFERLSWVPIVDRNRAVAFGWMFRVVIASSLVGHGSFKVGLTSLVPDAARLDATLGWFEIALGVLTLAWPATSIVAFVFVWKIATELLSAISGAYGGAFEFMERGSSYAVPLALLCVRAIAARTDAAAPRTWGRPIPAPLAGNGAFLDGLAVAPVPVRRDR